MIFVRICIIKWNEKWNKRTLIRRAGWIVVGAVRRRSIFRNDCHIIFVLCLPIKRRGRPYHASVTVDTELLVVHSDLFDPIRNLHRHTYWTGNGSLLSGHLTRHFLHCCSVQLRRIRFSPLVIKYQTLGTVVMLGKVTGKTSEKVWVQQFPEAYFWKTTYILE